MIMTSPARLFSGTKGVALKPKMEMPAVIGGIDFFNWTGRNVFAKVSESVAARLQRLAIDQTRLVAAF